MHDKDVKLFSAGWCPTMGFFFDLVKINDQDIRETVKECEFHFRGSINRKAKLFYELLCDGRRCKAIINHGILCFKFERLLTVLISGNNVVQQEFYFCTQKVCI